MSSTATWSLAGLTGIAMATAFWARHESIRTHAEIAPLTEQTSQLQSVLERSQATRLLSGSQSAPSGALPDPPAITNAAGADGSGAAAMVTNARVAPTTRKLSPRALIGNDPEQLAIYAANYRRTLDLELGGLIRRLELPPALASQIRELRAWREQRWLEVLAAAENQGLDPNGEGVRALWRQDEEIVRRREAELLGPLEDRYREFFRTNYVRGEVSRLASVEAYPNPPLTAAQVEQVTDILDAHSQRKPGTSWTYGTWLTIDWKSAARSLEAILTPSQLTHLQRIAAFHASIGQVEQRTATLTAKFRKERQPE